MGELKKQIAACAYCVHDDHWFLAHSIRSFDDVPCFAFVSETPWNGSAGVHRKSVEAARAAGATVVLGKWGSEAEQRQAALEYVAGLGFPFCLIPDGDEIIEPELPAWATRI